MYAALNPRSGNTKTGPIATYETSSDTCPRSCGQFSTCYAKHHHAAIHWKRLDAGKRGFPIHELAEKLRALPAGSMLRGNQWGDQPGQDGAIDRAAFRSLVASTAHLIAWTYTHKPITGQNAREIRSANVLALESGRGMVVNLSADTLAQADHLAGLGVGPVVVVMPSDAPKVSRTPQGRTVVACPATQRDEVTCSNCGNGRPLCARVDRSYIIGFPAHGPGKSEVNRRLKVIQ